METSYNPNGPLASDLIRLHCSFYHKMFDILRGVGVATILTTNFHTDTKYIFIYIYTQYHNLNDNHI